MKKLLANIFNWQTNYLNSQQGYLKLYHNNIQVGWVKQAERGSIIKFKVKWEEYYEGVGCTIIPQYKGRQIAHYELSII